MRAEVSSDEASGSVFQRHHVDTHQQNHLACARAWIATSPRLVTGRYCSTDFSSAARTTPPTSRRESPLLFADRQGSPGQRACFCKPEAAMCVPARALFVNQRQWLGPDSAMNHVRRFGELTGQNRSGFSVRSARAVLLDWFGAALLVMMGTSTARKRYSAPSSAAPRVWSCT
jgi:hypothetical protein